MSLIAEQFESLVDNEVDAVVRAGLFPDRQAVVRTAVKELFENHPNVRLEAAIEMYRNDEISLTRGAEIAGIDFWTFRKLLAARGIPYVIEARPAEEMDRNIEAFFAEPHE